MSGKEVAPRLNPQGIVATPEKYHHLIKFGDVAKLAEKNNRIQIF